MRRRTALATAVAGVLALLATILAIGVTSPASAARVWVDAPDVADTGDQVTQLHVASFPHALPGGSALVWVDGATDDVVTAFRPDGGAWGAPVTLAKPAGAPRIETVRSDETGRTHLSVSYRVGSGLWTVTEDRTYAGEVTVSTPKQVSTSYVAGTASESGDSLLWAEDLGGGQQRLVSNYNDQPQVEVEEPPAPVTYRETSGTLVGEGEREAHYLAWVAETAGGAQQLYIKTRGRPATALGRTGSTFTDLSFHSSGNLAWVEKPASGPAQVRVALAKIDGTVTVGDVPTSTGTPAAPSVARLAGSGRVLVWREQDGSSWSVRSSTAGPDSTYWTPPVIVDSGAGTLSANRFAAATSSTGQVASWCHLDGGACSVRGAFRAGKTWRPVTTLGTVADATDARLARPAVPSFPGSQDAPAAAWTDGGDDVRVAAIDYVGPVTRTTPKPVATFNGGVSTSWSAVDDWSKVSSYRLETSAVPFRKHAVDDAEWRAAAPTTATSRRLPVGPGQTRCWRVNATDAVGNLGADSGDQCIIAPLDDRLLTRSVSWRKVGDSLSYQGTLLRSTHRGATITIKNYPYAKVLVLVRRLPSGGAFEVLLNGKRIRALTTRGDSRRIVALPSPAASSKYQNLKKANRTLQIRVITDGKPVYIDGLFLGGSLPTAKSVNLLTR